MVDEADSPAASKQGPSLWTICVKTMDDEIQRFEVQVDANLGDLRRQIAERMGIPLMLQRIIFQGKVLTSDDTTLASIGITNGITVHLIIRNIPPAPLRSEVERPQPTEPTSSHQSVDEVTSNGLVTWRVAVADGTENEFIITLPTARGIAIEAISRLTYLPESVRERFEIVDHSDGFTISIPSLAPRFASPALERLNIVERGLRNLNHSMDVIEETNGLLSIVSAVVNNSQPLPSEDPLSDEVIRLLNEATRRLETPLDTPVSYNYFVLPTNETAIQRERREETVGTITIVHALDTDLSLVMERVNNVQSRLNRLGPLYHRAIVFDTHSLTEATGGILNERDYRLRALEIFNEHMLRNNHLLGHILHVLTEIGYTPTDRLPRRLLPSYENSRILSPRLLRRAIRFTFNRAVIIPDQPRMTRGVWELLVPHRRVFDVLPVNPENWANITSYTNVPVELGRNVTRPLERPQVSQSPNFVAVPVTDEASLQRILAAGVQFPYVIGNLPNYNQEGNRPPPGQPGRRGHQLLESYMMGPNGPVLYSRRTTSSNSPPQQPLVLSTTRPVTMEGRRNGANFVDTQLPSFNRIEQNQLHFFPRALARGLEGLYDRINRLGELEQREEVYNSFYILRNQSATLLRHVLSLNRAESEDRRNSIWAMIRQLRTQFYQLQVDMLEGIPTQITTAMMMRIRANAPANQLPEDPRLLLIHPILVSVYLSMEQIPDIREVVLPLTHRVNWAGRPLDQRYLVDAVPELDHHLSFITMEDELEILPQGLNSWTTRTRRRVRATVTSVNEFGQRLQRDLSNVFDTPAVNRQPSTSRNTTPAGHGALATPASVGPSTSILNPVPVQDSQVRVSSAAEEITSRFRTEALTRIAASITESLARTNPEWNINLTQLPVQTVRRMMTVALELLGFSIEDTRARIDRLTQILTDEDRLVEHVTSSLRNLFVSQVGLNVNPQAVGGDISVESVFALIQEPQPEASPQVGPSARPLPDLGLHNLPSFNFEALFSRDEEGESQSRNVQSTAPANRPSPAQGIRGSRPSQSPFNLNNMARAVPINPAASRPVQAPFISLEVSDPANVNQSRRTRQLDQIALRLGLSSSPRTPRSSSYYGSTPMGTSTGNTAERRRLTNERVEEAPYSDPFLNCDSRHSEQGRLNGANRDAATTQQLMPESFEQTVMYRNIMAEIGPIRRPNITVANDDGYRRLVDRDSENSIIFTNNQPGFDNFRSFVETAIRNAYGYQLEELQGLQFAQIVPRGFMEASVNNRINRRDSNRTQERGAQTTAPAVRTFQESDARAGREALSDLYDAISENPYVPDGVVGFVVAFLRPHITANQFAEFFIPQLNTRLLHSISPRVFRAIRQQLVSRLFRGNENPDDRTIRNIANTMATAVATIEPFFNEQNQRTIWLNMEGASPGTYVQAAEQHTIYELIRLILFCRPEALQNQLQLTLLLFFRMVCAVVYLCLQRTRSQMASFITDAFRSPRFFYPNWASLFDEDAVQRYTQFAVTRIFNPENDVGLLSAVMRTRRVQNELNASRPRRRLRTAVVTSAVNDNSPDSTSDERESSPSPVRRAPVRSEVPAPPPPSSTPPTAAPPTVNAETPEQANQPKRRKCSEEDEEEEEEEEEEEGAAGSSSQVDPRIVELVKIFSEEDQAVILNDVKKINKKK